MASREDIQEGRLRYTCNCGWVDWGHANPGGAKKLWNQIRTDKGSLGDMFKGADIRLNGHPAYYIWYTQSMGKLGIPLATKGRRFVIRKGLSEVRKKQVALAIFQSVSNAFEAMQGRMPWRPVSGHSSFSIEDLISNMIGFYRAVDGYSDPKVRGWCGDVGMKASLEVWDCYLQGDLDAYKSFSFTKPQYFACEECPKPGSFPSKLATIKPAVDGFDYVWVQRGISTGLLRDGIILDFNSNGGYRVKYK